MKKVVFYAPIGNLIEGFKNGGAEAGCRKTMEVLKKAEYDVVLIEKPARKSGSRIQGYILLFRLLIVWLRLLVCFLRYPNSIFHISGFYLKQSRVELFFIKTARLFGQKVIYEIRNGGMIESYWNGTEGYRKAMDAIFTSADLVFCQGLDYVQFLKEKYNIAGVYYPNYIMDSFITSNQSLRDHELKLIYFGRVVPDKNIEFIVDICNDLKQQDISFHLDIVGGYENDYYNFLLGKISKYSMENEVRFHGRQSFEQIYKLLKTAHFFVFPSKEKREGQSNSLTEAMGCGVVPIVSDAGFNRSVVADPALVIKNYISSDYAKAILQIWENDTWQKKSDEVYNRILQYYTESIVKKSFLAAYQRLELK